MRLSNLITQAKELLDNGVYHQDALFAAMYPGSRVHYATVRKAIHIAKCGL